MKRRAIFTSAGLKLNLAKPSGYILSVTVFGFGLLHTAYALDGTRSPADTAPMIGTVPGIGRVAPQEGVAYSGYLREWLRARQLGDMDAARKFLEDGARDGDVGAAWELGRMYADGDGVKQNHQLAFEYFLGIANSHADDVTGTTRARFVANAFVRLGRYYLTGIANSNIKPDAVRGRDMFDYAASYFGDPDAQYHLGRMYLDGQGVGKDTKQGIRWLSLAANKGQYQAQAVLGVLLFKGQYAPRDAARGLMWLMLAHDAATPEETWITDQYTAAWKQATETERSVAPGYLEKWIEQHGRRRQ
jgi:TPR repeat protein